MRLHASNSGRVRSGRRPYAVVLGTIFAILAFAALPAFAQPTQLTMNGDPSCELFAPVTNGAGSTAVFASNCDLVGTNADGNREVFSVDDAGGVFQLTDTVDCANTSPSFNSLATAIAFDSDCDLTGANGDGSVEIFLFGAGGIVQLTDSSFCTSQFPSINDAGNSVAFESDCDFLGTNFDRNSEIFRVTAGGQVTQLTDDRTADGCGSYNAASNASGALVAFESDCDLIGFNETEILEIFQVNGGGAVTQLTTSEDDTCGSGMPASNAAGDIIAFESDCDFLGTNSDNGIEIFNVTSGGMLIQVSTSATEACDSVLPAINASGTVTVYTSYCDPYGTNADGSFELFAAGPIAGSQLTSGQSCSSYAAAVTPDGFTATYVSDCDPVGENADGSEDIFQGGVVICGVCGAPASGASPPRASDALFVLQAAIGAKACPACTCDVDSNQLVTATDALIVLRTAVGQGSGLNCPAPVL